MSGAALSEDPTTSTDSPSHLALSVGVNAHAGTTGARAVRVGKAGCTEGLLTLTDGAIGPFPRLADRSVGARARAERRECEQAGPEQKGAADRAMNGID
jgi:hypothetical protein